MSKQTLDHLQEVTGITYSEEQAKLIDSKGGGCVLACAGSGKTTALTHLVARRIIDKEVTSGRRILGVTFSKTGASEMDERLEDLLDKLDIHDTVKMKTLHAFCLEFLRTIGAMHGRSILKEYDKLEALQLIGKTQTNGWKYEDAEKIAELMTLQRGSLQRRDNFFNTAEFRCSKIETLKYAIVYDSYQKYKADNNVIDFDDMLLLAHYKLRQSEFYGSRFMDMYQCVLVDEAQDMSKLQYRIVLQILGSDAVSPEEFRQHVRDTLVLIGDDDQCIYEWMGSEPQELMNVKEAFQLPLYQLSTNYRCPANILNAASRCIAHNTHSVPKSMNASKIDGVLRYDRVRGGGFAAESKHVAECILNQLQSGVEPSSIAIIARNGAHLSLVWLYLTCFGVKSRLFGGDSSGPDALIKHLFNCFKLYTTTTGAGEVLYALFGGDKSSSEKLSTLINLVDGSFVEWLEYIVAAYVPKTTGVLREHNAYAEAGKAWKTTMHEYYQNGLIKKSNTMQNIIRLCVAGKQSQVSFYLELLDIYEDMMEWKYKSNDAIRIFKGTIRAMRDLLSKHQEQALPILTTLDKHKAPNKKYITLTTAHSAKGREWNSVYILCDDAYAFPSEVSLTVLRDLNDKKAIHKYMESERRLHYVAMTRAKELLHIVGGDVPPGRFLAEALADSTGARHSLQLGTDVTVDLGVVKSEVVEEVKASIEQSIEGGKKKSKQEYSMHDLDI